MTDSAESRDVDITADYNLTWKEVFRNTIRAICEQSRRLEVLTAFQHDPIPSNNAQPSWVGRWESDPVFLDFVRGSNVARGDTQPHLETHIDQDILVAKGFTVNEVQAVNEPSLMPELGLGELGTVEGHVFEDAWTLIQTTIMTESQIAGSSDPQTLESYIPALAQTLCCDATPLQTQTDPRLAQIQILLSFALYQVQMAFMTLRGNTPTRQSQRAS